MTEKLWGGRFMKKTGRLMEKFSSSLSFDRRLYRAEIEAGIAHARVLARGGYLTARERDRVIKALREIRGEIEAGKRRFSGNYEDIHSFVVGRLVKKAGPVGNKLHTGRSRNDLVVLDTRLYLKEEGKTLLRALTGLQKALVKKGVAWEKTVIPGYTHLQHAQPVLLAHHLLAYVEMLERDKERLRGGLKRADVCPAGAAALAGTGLKLDWKLLAGLLGFSAMSNNSLDAVGDRDFVAEILAVLAIIGAHLSRLAEELVLWSTEEFDFIRLDESYCTGSSFLPQKLNPDAVELIRGKTGRLYGNLIALLTVLKGIPLSYNRDLQEDKEPLFDSLDTVKESLEILTAVVTTMRFKPRSLMRSLEKDYSSSADLAEYLVKKGVTFREAHTAVGKLVRWCLDNGVVFSKVTLDDLRKFSPEFEESALRLLVAERSVRTKTTAAGTAPVRVKRNLKRWKKKLGI